jgi:siroheme synthase (precorrin-2 oxidase/ferrochelatase)
VILPISLDCRDLRILFVGAGKAAAAKLRFLAELGAAQGSGHTDSAESGWPAIRVVAPAVNPEIPALGAAHPFPEFTVEIRRYVVSDLDGVDLVYCFTDDPALNGAVAAACRAQRLPCNAAGQRGRGGFSSPAARVAGGFLLSVASQPPHDPRASRELLERLSAAVPRSIACVGASVPPASAPPAVPEGTAGYLPMMLGLRSVVVFGGESGEGLAKAEKLALYAPRVRVVPAVDAAGLAALAAGCPELYQSDSGRDWRLRFPAGPVRHIEERLEFPEERSALIDTQNAEWYLAPGREAELAALLADVDFVCISLDAEAWNETLHRACAAAGIRHVAVDKKPWSDTWFMSLVDSGSLVAGLSSRGASPFYLKQMRRELEEGFPSRARLAAALQAVGRGLLAGMDREARLSALEAVYHDPDFRRLAKTGPADAALARATAVIEGNGGSQITGGAAPPRV